MVEEYEKCAFCYKAKKLSFSHIIPNSFIKKVRRKSPQLIAVRTDDKILKYENMKMLVLERNYFATTVSNSLVHHLNPMALAY